MSVLDLSRWQFAITLLFHMTFPAITVGLSILLSVLYGCYWQTDDVRCRWGGQLAHRLGELVVAPCVGVLVDHRRPNGGVAKPVLQLAQAGASLAGHGGAGVPQVVPGEVGAADADPGAAERALPQLGRCDPAALVGEDQRLGAGTGEPLHVVGQHHDDVRREVHSAAGALGLGSAEEGGSPGRWVTARSACTVPASTSTWRRASPNSSPARKPDHAATWTAAAIAAA